MTSPYRTGAGDRSTCSSCGAPRSSEARVCAGCGAEASAVRCRACFALNPVGRSDCQGCGAALDLEAELAPTLYQCPRCRGPLAILDLGDGALHECPTCGGLFIEHGAMAKLVTEHRAVASPSIPPRAAPPDVEVSYVPCPICCERMNRTVFGRRSGVVVDICKLHGTWFDAHELTAALAFVERGGLEAAEKRALAEADEAQRKAALERRIEEMRGAISRPGQTRLGALLDPRPARTEGLLQLLDVLGRR